MATADHLLMENIAELMEDLGFKISAYDELIHFKFPEIEVEL